ncbi:MAG: class I SAM-dependent methyltransferase [Oscillospiraceae bacterium]|nr:class I SAM-dependent methyltransferase [Oscillospiraceae bacterium]
MIYTRSKKYDKELIRSKIMGPNPIKLEEELLSDHLIPADSLVMDLGSGQGLTSVFLVKEYGFKVIAADLWSNPTDNKHFFDEMGLTPHEIIPVHADAEDLPFAHDTFDAVVCTDSYNYFGRNKHYLDEKLAPFVRPGGYIYIAVPGMKKDLHDNIPPELLLSWTPEQLDYIHDINYWKDIISSSELTQTVSIYEMQSNEEVWYDWIDCDNEYAQGDKKAIEAGGTRYLNFIAVVLKKKESI